MPNISMPNGDVVAFPDDMPREQIKGMIASKFPDVAKVTSPSSTKGDDLGAIASGVQGFNSTVPFGNRLTAGAAALANYPIAKLEGANVGLSDLYDTARANQEATQQAHPTANLVGTGSGIVNSLPLFLSKAISATPILGDAANAIQKGNSAAADWLGGGNLAARMGKGIGAGAVSGSIYGAGNAPENKMLEGAKSGAISGGVVGGAIPIAGAIANDVYQTGKNAVQGAFARSPDAVQNAAESFKNSAGNLYDQMRQVGATFNPSATKNLVSNLDNAVSSNQFIPELNPKTTAIVNRIQNAAENGTLGLDDLDQYRRLLGRVGATEDGVSAGKVRNAIDNFVNSASGKDLVNGAKYTANDLTSAQNELQNLQGLHDNLIGAVQDKAQLAGKQGGFWRGRSVTQAADEAKNLANVKQQISSQSNLINHIQENISNAPLAEQKAQQAISLLNQGRKQYQQASKFEDVADILSKADGDANKIKSGLKRFLVNNNNAPAGWSASEISALKNAASTGGTEALLKMGGKFGIDLGSSLNVGNTIGPVVGYGVGGGVAPIAGTAARQAQKWTARGKAENLLNVLQNGSQGAVNSGSSISPILSAPAAGAAGIINNPKAAISNTASPIMPQVTTPAVSIPPQANNTSQTPDLFSRVVNQESGGKQFNAKGNPLISNKGAIGSAQVTIGTAPEAARAAGLPYSPKRLYTDQAYNEALGKAYLGKMQAKYGDDTLALMAYNWGPGNVDSWLKRGANPNQVPTETKNYVKRILGS